MVCNTINNYTDIISIYHNKQKITKEMSKDIVYVFETIYAISYIIK